MSIFRTKLKLHILNPFANVSIRQLPSFLSLSVPGKNKSVHGVRWHFKIHSYLYYHVVKHHRTAMLALRWLNANFSCWVKDWEILVLLPWNMARCRPGFRLFSVSSVADCLERGEMSLSDSLSFLATWNTAVWHLSFPCEYGWSHSTSGFPHGNLFQKNFVW